MLVDEDPQEALAHARYARQRASRIAVVREAAGIAAYHAGEWAEALGELRAARRMGGGPGHLAVMADIERALGRPERALELTRGPEARELDTADAIELAIVAAGARRDLGELDVAVVGLQLPELDPARREPWSARLFYAYADNLLAAGREAEALQWFMHTSDADEDGATDAARRIAELTGEPLPDDDVEFGIEDDERVTSEESADAVDAVAAEDGLVTSQQSGEELDDAQVDDEPTMIAATVDPVATAGAVAVPPETTAMPEEAADLATDPVPTVEPATGPAAGEAPKPPGAAAGQQSPPEAETTAAPDRSVAPEATADPEPPPVAEPAPAPEFEPPAEDPDR